MAQSSEYPDLRWIPPASYSSGRPAGPPRFIVIHTTEGSSHSQSAEDGAAYDARRADGTSTHYFVDDNSTVQCVRTTDRAHTAGPTGNLRGIQYELCARASYGRAWWLSGYGLAMLRRAAAQCARDAKRYGIPLRKLNPVQLANGGSGFVGHVDVTYAWGEVDHTDPGPNFPWAEFMTMVADASAPAPEDKGEDENVTQQSFALPHGFAYNENGDAIAPEFSISVPVEPAGLAANPVFGSKRLYVSLAGDHGKTRARIAINNGEGWTVKVYDVPVGGRVSVAVPAPKNGTAYNITAGRARTTADSAPSESQFPLSLLVTVA